MNVFFMVSGTGNCFIPVRDPLLFIPYYLFRLHEFKFIAINMLVILSEAWWKTIESFLDCFQYWVWCKTFCVNVLDDIYKNDFHKMTIISNIYAMPWNAKRKFFWFCFLFQKRASPATWKDPLLFESAPLSCSPMLCPKTSFEKCFVSGTRKDSIATKFNIVLYHHTEIALTLKGDATSHW